MLLDAALLLLDWPLPFDRLLDAELWVVPLPLALEAPLLTVEELLLVPPVALTPPVEAPVLVVEPVTIELPRPFDAGFESPLPPMEL